MNHLGKENSFSFQRTIHALNQGPKLIIRGDLDMNFANQVRRFIKDIINERRLIISLSKKDFTRRFAGSYLGTFWAFIQPLITILLYWFVFQFAFKSTDIDGYPFILWFMCGIIPWLFISEAIVMVSNSFLEYSYLVKKVIFNINILPIVKIISSLFVSLFFIVLMLILFILSGYQIDIYYLQLIYYIICMCCLVFVIGLILSSIMVFFRDLNQIISILLLMGMWLTPIAWDISIFDVKYHIIFKLNPIFYIVQGFRDSLISKVWFFERPEITVYFWSITGGLFLVSIFIYNRLKIHFADAL